MDFLYNKLSKNLRSVEKITKIGYKTIIFGGYGASVNRTWLIVLYQDELRPHTDSTYSYDAIFNYFAASILLKVAINTVDGFKLLMK